MNSKFMWFSFLLHIVIVRFEILQSFLVVAVYLDYIPIKTRIGQSRYNYCCIRLTNSALKHTLTHTHIQTRSCVCVCVCNQNLSDS